MHFYYTRVLRKIVVSLQLFCSDTCIFSRPCLIKLIDKIAEGSGEIRVELKQDSMFPMGPVIKFC